MIENNLIIIRFEPVNGKWYNYVLGSYANMSCIRKRCGLAEKVTLKYEELEALLDRDPEHNFYGVYGIDYHIHDPMPLRRNRNIESYKHLFPDINARKERHTILIRFKKGYNFLYFFGTEQILETYFKDYPDDYALKVDLTYDNLVDIMESEPVYLETVHIFVGTFDDNKGPIWHESSWESKNIEDYKHLFKKPKIKTKDRLAKLEAEVHSLKQENEGIRMLLDKLTNDIYPKIETLDNILKVLKGK